MNIVFDTNIFIQYPKLSSKEFDVILDYLERTKSKIILPQIVLEELPVVYKRNLIKKSEDANRYLKNLKQFIVGETVSDLQFDPDALTTKFMDNIKNKLKINFDEQVFPYKKEYFQESIRRSINRIRPCSEKREEFRDTILWLSVLDIARLTDERNVVFISGNKKDFLADAGNGQLHSDLLADVKNHRVTVKYYQNIHGFIQEHAVKLDYINEDLLNQFVEDYDLNTKVMDLLNKEGERLLLRWIENQGKETTDYYSIVSVDLQLSNYFIYELQDETFFVRCNYYTQAEVEFEIVRDFWEDPWDEDSIGLKFFYPEIEVYVNFYLNKNLDLRDLEISEWNII
jgi:hypothetical protein